MSGILLWKLICLTSISVHCQVVIYEIEDGSARLESDYTFNWTYNATGSLNGLFWFFNGKSGAENNLILQTFDGSSYSYGSGYNSSIVSVALDAPDGLEGARLTVSNLESSSFGVYAVRVSYGSSTENAFSNLTLDDSDPDVDISCTVGDDSTVYHPNATIPEDKFEIGKSFIVNFDTGSYVKARRISVHNGIGNQLDSETNVYYAELTVDIQEVGEKLNFSVWHKTRRDYIFTFGATATITESTTATETPTDGPNSPDLTTIPPPPPTGLSVGKIAAIVVCSIVGVILIIVIVVCSCRHCKCCDAECCMECCADYCAEFGGGWHNRRSKKKKVPTATLR